MKLYLQQVDIVSRRYPKHPEGDCIAPIHIASAVFQ